MWATQLADESRRPAPTRERAAEVGSRARGIWRRSDLSVNLSHRKREVELSKPIMLAIAMLLLLEPTLASAGPNPAVCLRLRKIFDACEQKQIKAHKPVFPACTPQMNQMKESWLRVVGFPRRVQKTSIVAINPLAPPVRCVRAAVRPQSSR